MRALTPNGYVDPFMLTNGSDLCAFDEVNSGVAIINQVENIDFVDYQEWCRWHKLEDSVPSFDWYLINDQYWLFREQSVWRNGLNVCHARDLVVGDIIYDDHDDPVVIVSIECCEDRSRVWYRFDVSGDHSYIVDGLTVHNASRFWVGGTGSLTSSNTTSWAASSGGAGGQSVPGSADAATWDANSGGGTTTLNFGGTWTVQSATMGAYTNGTWDNSVNNNNVTMNATGAFSGTGTVTRTIKLGSATYNLTASGAVWELTTTSLLTFTGSSATIVFSGGSSNGLAFHGGGQTYGTVSFGATSGTGSYLINGNNTFSSISITGPCVVHLNTGSTQTISSAVNIAGGASSEIFMQSASTTGATATIACAAGSTFAWCAFRSLIFTGSPTTTNCTDLGNNSGIPVNPPPGRAPAPLVVGRGTPY